MNTIYLHGFASGPSSRKAQFFRERFAEHGLPLEIPQMDEGDFEHLTISGQLSLLERLAGGRPVSLIGSSMGGYVAALYAARHPEVEKLVLLAPAFYFPQRWKQELGTTVAAKWKRSGTMSVYHYSDGRMRDVRYELVEDGARYEMAPDVRQPTLIFHGLKDTVVPAAYSKEFAAAHPGNVHLTLLDSGHELTDVLEPIWAETNNFLIQSL
jgi:pimeloyl-ACP methyl ester carboxylesterase